MKKAGKIVIISGPSGSGKTTLYKRLLKSEKLRRFLTKSISVTTRNPREGEKHGRDYVFVSPKMFSYKKKAGHFLESQKVYDNYYGTPHKSVRDIIQAGKNVLLCIDVKGASVVARKFPKAVRIFIKTATFEDLKKRLQSRGSEEDDTLRLRLETAKEELKESKKYDHIIVNDDVEKAYGKLEAVVEKVLQ